MAAIAASERRRDGHSSSPDQRERRRRPLPTPVGPPLMETAQESRQSQAQAQGQSSSQSRGPKALLPTRPSMPWGIGGWVMDLSMYEQPAEPAPVHKENRTTWPRAFLDYSEDTKIMDDLTMQARGDAIAQIVRRECAQRARQPARPMQMQSQSSSSPTQPRAKPELRKTYDSARCLYVVHASVDLNVGFDDVLAVLNDKTFLSHVFGHQMAASAQMRCCGPRTNVRRLTLHVPRGYKRHQPMDVSYLDHVVADRTSWTCAMKTIDSNDGSSSSSTSNSNAQMLHLLCGLHLEAIATLSMHSRCRLTFYGDSCMPSVLAVKDDGANYFLDAFGQSVLLVQRIIRRRRRHSHALASPERASSRRPGHKRCRLCTKSFHLFRHAHSCRVCLSRVCADCSDIEEVDSPDGMYVDDVMRICHGCRATALSSPEGSPSSATVPAPIFQPVACHVCLEPFRADTQVQCCKVCDQNGCASCGIFDEDHTHQPTKALLWTCRRCLVPTRRSLSANYFSTLDEDDPDGLPQIMCRRASFD